VNQPASPVAPIIQIPPFSEFTEAELTELLPRVQRRSYRTEETIFREGDPPAFVYYVLSGEISLTLTSEDRRISVGKFPAGRLLGIQTIFDDGPQFVSATALSPTTVLAVPLGELLASLRRHPDALLKMAGIFARQIREAARLVAEMQFLDLPVRLAKRILDLADASAVSSGRQGPAVKITQKELSELAGATRGGVNRALKRLEHLGLVRTSRGTITISALDRLRRLAEQEPLPMILGLTPPPKGHIQSSKK
jgi:CRP/FNR family transcriptional regulator/CRP/FNR family cyclic AMP-dependent transcriptional regulator